MKTVQILRPLVLWRFILTLLLIMAWLGVSPAQGADASVVTFYVH